MKQFKIAPSFECDILRTERGLSCQSISQLPAKATFINVRFIKKLYETKKTLGPPLNSKAFSKSETPSTLLCLIGEEGGCRIKCNRGK